MLFKQKISNLFEPNIIIDINRSIKLTSASIKISKDYINVTVPFLISNRKIYELLKKKNERKKKQLIIQQNIQPFKQKDYVNNEEFKYLGKNYKLKIIKGNKYSVKIESNLLIVIVKNSENIDKIKRLINNWFHEKSINYLKEKTYLYAKENKLIVTLVKIREYKSRWGSCDIKGNITYNWRLIMAPPGVIKYVIIHELVHLIEHNHSPKYWEHVRKIYPNIDEAKKWLIYNGKSLNI